MDLNLMFNDFLKDAEDYKEAVEIVRANSSGKIWLLGGYIFRNLSYLLYNDIKPYSDLDFVVEKSNKKFILPEGWQLHKNRFENPKFKSGNKQIDYMPIESIIQIKEQKAAPTIENVLLGAPLNIEAIAYDVCEKKLIGEKGIDAILRRVVEVNNLYYARFSAEHKGRTLKNFIIKKAKSLGYEYRLPENC